MIMNDKIDLKQELENFKEQVKEVNKSFTQFELGFAQEKQKIDKLRESFAIIIKLINSELLHSLDENKFTLEQVVTLLKK